MLYYCIAFAIGYVIGRIDIIVVLLKKQNDDGIELSKPKSFLLTEKSTAKKNIEIDTRTFVTEVETDNYVKNFDTLGKETVVSDNVSAAASKLSQLKKK